MKLIMESWRRYKKEDNSTLILREIKQHLEIHSVIQEGFFDDLAEKIPGGKKALPLILTGMLAAGALSPDVAAAAETYVDDSGVNVAQQIDDNTAEEEAKKPVAQAFRKIFQNVGDSFRKDGKIGKLFSKIDKSQDQMSDSESKDLIIRHIEAKAESGIDLTPDEKQLLDLYNQHGPIWDSKNEK